MPDYSGRTTIGKSELELMLDDRRTDLDAMLETVAELPTDEAPSIERFEDLLELTDSWAVELKKKYEEQKAPLEKALDRTEALFKPLRERLKLARSLATSRLEVTRESVRASAKSGTMERVMPDKRANQAFQAALSHGRKRA